MPTATLLPPMPSPAAAPARAGERLAIPPVFETAAQWHDALGNVPMDRVIFSPWPGTATEADLLLRIEGGEPLCELLDGTLVEKPVGTDESVIAGVIIYYLNAFIIPRKLGVVTGEAGMLRMAVSPRIRLPDVGYISADRWTQVPKPRPRVVPIAPDLAVEVLSASNTAAEISAKLRDYFGSGTRLVWVVDPSDRTVDVYVEAANLSKTLTASEQIDGGDVLPGFTVGVADLCRQVDDE